MAPFACTPGELESVGKAWTAADAPGAARATTGAPSSAVASRYSSIATAGIATHGALHGPRSCGLVRRHRTPDTAQPDAPCATCTSRCLLPLAAPILSRGSARLLRMAAPRGRAPSATRMWSAGLPGGPAAGRHAFAHCHGLRVTTCSLPPSSLESAFVSVPAAVTSTLRSRPTSPGRV